MKAIFDNEIIDDRKLILYTDDRAIQYGDGLFETIIIRNSHSNLSDYHFSRLKNRAKVPGYKLYIYFTQKNLNSLFIKLRETNDLKGLIRIKVQILRNSGGYYKPGSDASNILLSARLHHDKEIIFKNVGFSKMIKNNPSPYS